MCGGGVNRNKNENICLYVMTVRLYVERVNWEINKKMLGENRKKKKIHPMTTSDVVACCNDDRAKWPKFDGRGGGASRHLHGILDTYVESQAYAPLLE